MRILLSSVSSIFLPVWGCVHVRFSQIWWLFITFSGYVLLWFFLEFAPEIRGVRQNVKLLMLVADLKVGFGFQSSDDGFGVLCIFRVCFRCLLVATNLLLAADLATQWVFSDGIQRCGGGG
jgi:hypothetical protein